MASSAKGFPTKEFFVEILTRDIELNDAILDLLDNCIDGVIRLKNGVARDDNFYSSFCADIKINPNYSRISGIAYENGYVRENSSKTDTLQSFPPNKGALLPWGSDNF